MRDVEGTTNKGSQANMPFLPLARLWPSPPLPPQSLSSSCELSDLIHQKVGLILEAHRTQNEGTA